MYHCVSPSFSWWILRFSPFGSCEHTAAMNVHVQVSDLLLSILLGLCLTVCRTAILLSRVTMLFYIPIKYAQRFWFLHILTNTYFLVFDLIIVWQLLGFPSDSDGKESAYNAGDPSLIPGLGRSLGEWNGYLLQYSCLENFHGERSLVGYSSHPMDSQRVGHNWVIFWATVIL